MTDTGSSTLAKPAEANGVSILDLSRVGGTDSMKTMLSHFKYTLEHTDIGAYFYRHYFYQQDHSNLFGVDENLGPVAVSMRREKLDEGGPQISSNAYIFRLVVRTCELNTIRGSILEDCIPSLGKHNREKGASVKDLLEYVVPELQHSSLHTAVQSPKIEEQLLKLDEQVVSNNYKVGVMYCKAGQSTEEEMYNNEHAGPAFNEFLTLLGKRVRLKGWEKYRGGLDCKGDLTGSYSLYTTYQKCEVMFHVSTMLPYTHNNKQQLLRKRHIGNDIVTIVFQEPGAHAFTPKNVRSQFQHVFVIVRVHNPNKEHVKYSVAVARSKDVPAFGPLLPDGATFRKSPDFTDFLITKVINAENATRKSEKFIAMATRTRQEYLKDLALNSVTDTALESGSKFGKFSLSVKKKDKQRPRFIYDRALRGGIVWRVQVEDLGHSSIIDCHLVVSIDFLVLIEDSSREVLWSTATYTVLGWSIWYNSLKLFYNHGDCISLKTLDTDISDELQEIVCRLSAVTNGCETVEMTLQRNKLGQLGFHIQQEGVVSEVEMNGHAWQAGLRQGCRLVEICKVATITLTHEQMIDILRTSAVVKVAVISAHDNGTPRRGCDRSTCTHHGHKQPSVNATVVRLPTPMQHDLSPSVRGATGTASRYVQLKTVAEQRAPFNYENTSHCSPPLSSLAEHSESSGHGSSALEGRNSRESGERCSKPYKTLADSPALAAADRPTTDRFDSQHHQPYNIQTPAPTHPHHHHFINHHQGGSTLDSNQSHKSSCGSSHGTLDSQHSSSSSHHSHSSSSAARKSTPPPPIPLRSASKERKPITTTIHPALPSPHRSSTSNGSSPSSVPGLVDDKWYDTSETLEVDLLNYQDAAEDCHLRSTEYPATSIHTRATRTPGQRNSTHNTFQEELMRLIDPDLSIESCAAAAGGESLSVHHGNNPASRQPVVPCQTMPDKSVQVCSSSKLSNTGCSQSPLDIRQMKLSPRATAANTAQATDHANSSCKKVLPLVDATSGLDWSDLVDVATKAFEDGTSGASTMSSTASSSSCGVRVDLTRADLAGAATEIKTSKKTLFLPSNHQNLQQHPPLTQTTSIPVAKNCPSHTASNLSPKDLNNKVQSLEQQLLKEQRDKAALEAEILKLRKDNGRLQEESQTAASQLRKFTEWFFNTIDRQ